MTEQEKVKNQLKEQLEKINIRLQILDMIEDKLLKMKKLTQRVVDEDLTDKEIKEINRQVQDLGGQVNLLDNEPTKLS